MHRQVFQPEKKREETNRHPIGTPVLRPAEVPLFLLAVDLLDAKGGESQKEHDSMGCNLGMLFFG